METLLAFVQLSAYFAVMTLAGYMLNRSRYSPLALAMASALISFAAITADQFLGAAFPGQAVGLGRVLWGVYPLPVAFWFRIAILLKPGEFDVRLDRVWWTLLLPVTVLLILGGWIGDDLLDFSTRQPGALFWTYGVYNVVAATGALLLLHLNYQSLSHSDPMRTPFYWMRFAGVAYTGSMVILLTQLIPLDVLFALLVVDVIMLGLGVIVHDAMSEGQVIKYDLTATFIKIALVMMVLIIPWGVALMATGVWAWEFAAAMFLSLGALSLGMMLLSDLEALLDGLFLPISDEKTRTALRTLILNTARAGRTPLETRDPDEFLRLTRRAISNMPNLPRLAASPLTEMNVVTTRLEDDANALERANELRRVLTECIEGLRPAERGDYGTGDEWRFYNALYYPYVVGLSPYKRSQNFEQLDTPTEEVLRWFQVAVPPRTLYNWQNRAAELIATILMEREAQYRHPH